MSLLELLASSGGGLTLSELSRKLNMPKSTTHYLINTLETRGYLQRTSNGRHSLGLRFADVANASGAEQRIAALAMPYLRRIASSLNLTAIVAALRCSEGFILGSATAADDSGGGAWAGHHIDLHCTALGKALIASDEPDLNQLFGGRALARFTPKTLVCFSALKTHLCEVRANGFSVNDEEHVYGIRAVGAPVVDSQGLVIAALSARGSTDQIPLYRIHKIGWELIRASRDLTVRLSQDF